MEDAGAATAVYVTLLAVYRQVLRRDGIAGFWSGLGPNVAHILVNAAGLGGRDHAVHLLAPLLGHGTIAAGGGVLRRRLLLGVHPTPADVIKTRLMQQVAPTPTSANTGVVDALATTLRREGARRWQGFVPARAQAARLRLLEHARRARRHRNNFS